MWIEGTIRPLETGEGFTREAWCQLIARRPEFRRHPPVRGRNPFTGRTITLPPRDDSADVVQDGVVVGRAYWSMSVEEPLVNLCVEETALPLVLEWARALGGEFRREWRGLLED
jgi:hypothetical protein